MHYSIWEKNDKTMKDPTITQQKPIPDDEPLMNSLRAHTWSEFLGQDRIKKTLRVAIDAAKKRGDPLEHILLYGPPGLGKTTMAHILGSEMGVNVRATAGPALERAGDLASILTNLESNDILFIDEIHRIPKPVEETLYSAMEDYCLDIVIGKGPAARTVRLDLPKFTIIGATTRIGLLSSPLRDRFGVITRMEFYAPHDIEKILTQGAEKLSLTITQDAKQELAKRSRGTPRIALRLLKRVRDVAQVHGDGTVTSQILDRALDLLDVDHSGLDISDRRLLITIIDKFNGGPVGIETLAAALSEDIGTIEDVLEPYLMQLGLLKRTPRGRVITKEGFKHLGKTIPQSLSQENLL
jgi:holliday junction DNA helicase RuvB